MGRFIRAWQKVGKGSHLLAGIILATMFLVTLAEVLGRFLWGPIGGSYELISFLGGLIIGFSVPYTSQMNDHMNVDFVISKMPEMPQRVMTATTRILVSVFFVLVGGSLIYMGIGLWEAQEVSQTLKIPYYPVAFGMGLGFLIQAGQFMLDGVGLFWRNDE